MVVSLVVLYLFVTSFAFTSFHFPKFTEFATPQTAGKAGNVTVVRLPPLYALLNETLVRYTNGTFVIYAERVKDRPSESRVTRSPEPLATLLEDLLSKPLPPEKYSQVVSVADAFATAENETGNVTYPFLPPFTNDTLEVVLPTYALSNATVPYPPTATTKIYCWHWVSSYTLVYATAKMHFHYVGDELYLESRDYLVVTTSTTKGVKTREIFCDCVDEPVGYGFTHAFGYYRGLGPIGEVVAVNDSGSIWAYVNSRYLYYVGETYCLCPLVVVYNGNHPFVVVEVKDGDVVRKTEFTLRGGKYEKYAFVPTYFNVTGSKEVEVRITVEDRVTLGKFHLLRKYPAATVKMKFSEEFSLPPFGVAKFLEPRLVLNDTSVNETNVTYPVTVEPSKYVQGLFLTAIYGRAISRTVSAFYDEHDRSSDVFKLTIPVQFLTNVRYSDVDNPFVALEKKEASKKAINEMTPLLWCWLFKARTYEGVVNDTDGSYVATVTTFALSNETPNTSVANYVRKRVLTNPYLLLDGDHVALTTAWGYSRELYLPPLLFRYVHGEEYLYPTTKLVRPGTRLEFGVVRVPPVEVNIGTVNYTAKCYVPATFLETYEKAANWKEYESYFTEKPFWVFW